MKIKGYIYKAEGWVPMERTLNAGMSAQIQHAAAEIARGRGESGPTSPTHEEMVQAANRVLREPGGPRHGDLDITDVSDV